MEQSYLNAKFVTPEQTLTAPNSRLRISTFVKLLYLNSLKILEKNHKKVISGKLKRFELLYL